MQILFSLKVTVLFLTYTLKQKLTPCYLVSVLFCSSSFPQSTDTNNSPRQTKHPHLYLQSEAQQNLQNTVNHKPNAGSEFHLNTETSYLKFSVCAKVLWVL